VQADGYWSSTTFASDISNAWLVDMIEGGVSFGDEAGSYYVWPVRGGQ
jgi:hypothetical protein